MNSAGSRRSRRSCLAAGATAKAGAASRSPVVLLHGDADVALGGDVAGPLVAGVDMPDHAHARVVGQNPLELLRGQRRAVGHADLAGVDGAADADTAAVMDRDPGRT